MPAQSHIFSQSSPYYPAPPTVPDPAVSGTTTTLAPSTGAYADTADLAATDRLLAAAGDVRAADGTWIQPGGGPFTVRLVVDAGDSWASSASPLVVADLEHAGIGVTVSTAPDAIATGMALATGTDDMALLPFVTNPYPTLAGAWYSLSLGPPGQYGSQGWSNFNDPTLNSLLDQAAQQLNPVTAAPIYAQADTVLWNDMVALPLFAEPVALGWSVYTNGVTTSLSAADFATVDGLLRSAPLRTSPPVCPSVSGADHIGFSITRPDGSSFSEDAIGCIQSTSANDLKTIYELAKSYDP